MAHIQLLESRRLFSADPIFELTSKGTLIVHGTADADAITVNVLHTGSLKFHVLVSLRVPPAGAPTIAHEFRSSMGQIKRFRVEAGDGDDSVDVLGRELLTKPGTVLGGNGDDDIGLLSDGPISVDSGDGNDSINELFEFSSVYGFEVKATKNREALDSAFAMNGGSVNTLLGGAGNDTVIADTNDVVDGGTGTDRGELGLFGSAFNESRREGLQHDFYARLGAIGLEDFNGFS